MMDYVELNKTLSELIDGVPYKTANLANAAALLYHTLDKINWAGFYLMEDGKLVLNAFQGKSACIEIPIGRGVCGTAAERRESVVVENVHLFPGHIACDSESESEIVIPLFSKENELVGVLDIDSYVEGRFKEIDRLGLETFANTLQKALW